MYIRDVKTFEYRLYPTKSQRALLMACLKESRKLYNEMLAMTKVQYRQTGRFLFKYALTKAFKGRGQAVPATTVQCLADRLDKALHNFLARKELGQPAGFPRFKPPNRWHSIHLRQWGKYRDVFFDGKYLKVPKKLGGKLKIKLHRPFEGTPKTCHLVLRADGHWYALIPCEIPTPPPDPSKPEIGLDMGLKHFLADSNGNTVTAPQCFRKSQAKLRVKQRTISRRPKGSNRRRKAAKETAHVHLKIARQRRDWLFKVAKPYAEDYSRIFVEDLNVSGMLKNHHLAKSISDASWSMFLEILAAKAGSAGHEVIKVPARFTTQKCSACGTLVPKSLSVRTHICPFCGFIADRDHNAALNILTAGAQRSGANVEEEFGVA